MTDPTPAPEPAEYATKKDLGLAVDALTGVIRDLIVGVFAALDEIEAATPTTAQTTRRTT